jgi:hypothetical protein
MHIHQGSMHARIDAHVMQHWRSFMRVHTTSICLLISIRVYKWERNRRPHLFVAVLHATLNHNQRHARYLHAHNSQNELFKNTYILQQIETASETSCMEYLCTCTHDEHMHTTHTWGSLSVTAETAMRSSLTKPARSISSSSDCATSLMLMPRSSCMYVRV